MKIERLNFKNKDGQKLSARLYLPLDEEMKEKLLEIANKCPLHRTLHEDIIIETKFK